ncbi:MAG: N-acetyl-gamma-glutamyl-phosphate reductase [Candidatus Zipacnadales bacterium]
MKVGIFGVSGYGGGELLRLLLGHPEVEISYVGGHKTAGEQLSDIHPQLRGRVHMEIEPSDPKVAIERCEFLFFSLEAKVGVPWIREALEAGRKVFDFSADFRLTSVECYEAYYGAHPAPDLLKEAVYGLPELHREAIRKARLVALPGCYPTGAILALAPLAQDRAFHTDMVIIDSKSGISGAGRTKWGLTYHFPEANERVMPYSAGVHRHTPEIDQERSRLGDPVAVTFTPHLIPMTRGILTTAYALLKQEQTVGELSERYRQFYADEPFVQVMPDGELPASKLAWGSNMCFVGLTVQRGTRKVIAVSAIDNLIKGQAGAGVQCMNLMCGFPETTGLTGAPIWP